VEEVLPFEELEFFAMVNTRGVARLDCLVHLIDERGGVPIALGKESADASLAEPVLGVPGIGFHAVVDAVPVAASGRVAVLRDFVAEKAEAKIEAKAGAGFAGVAGVFE
jgi:hypothetical protein